MSDAAEVIKVGTDSSGRTIYMTRYMAAWWERVVESLGFRPTIVQGAWMVRNGGGASASEGYHDGGGCLDLRVWDKSPEQVTAIIRVTRALGAASWRRDPQRGGFKDPHIHLVLGSDSGLASGAASQWRSYLAGKNGLASNGDDYEPRPNPLVTTPPPEDDMFSDDDRTTLNDIAGKVAVLERARVKTFERDREQAKTIRSLAGSERKRDKALADKLDAIAASLEDDGE